jgi:hypothetical protein
MPDTLPYQNLTPDCILDAIETCGYRCDGRLLALNSYENRVYQIGLDAGDMVVAKFYRPNRWSDDAILEAPVRAGTAARAGHRPCCSKATITQHAVSRVPVRASEFEEPHAAPD